jgi:cytochrome b pre-mRNA-processing protein 3
MLRFLFPGLTAAPERGEALFAAVTAKAREAHWFVEGEVPDTLDGRFRMLATLAALVIVRLEEDGAEGDEASVALTERFIQVMEAEHRELGLGDPALGRKVRKLVGSLGRRVDLFRAPMDWEAAVSDSVYAGAVVPHALEHTASALRDFSAGLGSVDVRALAEGRFA